MLLFLSSDLTTLRLNLNSPEYVEHSPIYTYTYTHTPPYIRSNYHTHTHTLFILISPTLPSSPSSSPPSPGIEPSVKTPNYEKGTYYFFDMVQWRKTLKELLIEYDRLEEKPQLPATLGVHHSAAVGTPTAATV